MTILTHLTADDRLYLAEALLLRRYAGHVLDGGIPVGGSEAQAYLSLRLAKVLGVRDEYLRVMAATDVLSIKVTNLEAPAKRGPREKRAAT